MISSMCKFDEFEDVKSFASAIRWRDDRSYAITEIFKSNPRGNDSGIQRESELT